MSTSNAAFVQGSSSTSSQSTTTSIPDEIIIPDSDEYEDPLPIPTTTRNRIPRSESRGASGSASARSSRSGSAAGSLPGSRAASLSGSRRVSPSRSGIDRGSSARNKSSSKKKGKRVPVKTEFGGEEAEMSAGPSRIVSSIEDRDGKGKGKGKKRQRSLGSEDEEEQEDSRPAPPRHPFGWRSPSVDSIPPTQDSQHPLPPDSQTSAILGPFSSVTEPEHISAGSATANLGGSPTFSDILNSAQERITHNSSSTLHSSDLSFTDIDDDDLDNDESFAQHIAATSRSSGSSIRIDELLNGPEPSSSSTWFLNREDDVHSRGFANEVNPFEDFYPPSTSAAASTTSYGQERERYASTSASRASASVDTTTNNNASSNSVRRTETLSDFANEPNPFEDDWYPQTSISMTSTFAANPTNVIPPSTTTGTRTDMSASTNSNSNLLRRRAESLADLFRDAIGDDHESYIMPEPSNSNAGTSGSSGASASLNPGPSASSLDLDGRTVWDLGSSFGRGYGGSSDPSNYSGGGGAVAGSSSSAGAGSSTAVMSSGSGSGSSIAIQPAPASSSAAGADAEEFGGVVDEIEISEEPTGRRSSRRNGGKGKGKGRQLVTWTEASSSSSGAGATAAASSSSSSSAPSAGAASSSSSSSAATSTSTAPSTTVITSTPTTTGTAATAKPTIPAPTPSAEPLSEYTCPICFFPPTNATITPCGHVCCGECLFSAVKAGQARNAPALGGAFAGLGGLAGFGGGAGGPLGPMGLALGIGAGRGRGRGGGAAGQAQMSNGALCPVCRAPIPGWDGRGGGVIGLKVRTVISI